MREFTAKHSDGVTHALGESVGGRHGDRVDPFLHQFRDVLEDAITVELAVGGAVGGDGRAAHQAEVAVARGLDGLL